MVPNTKDCKEVHLYNASNILRPQGSLKDESVSQHIFEKLMWAFSSWGNPKYEDSITDERKLIKLIQQNLHEEVEVAVEAFLESLRAGNVEGAYRYKM